MNGTQAQIHTNALSGFNLDKVLGSWTLLDQKNAPKVSDPYYEHLQIFF